jgi:hypothetical protein
MPVPVLIPVTVPVVIPGTVPVLIPVTVPVLIPVTVPVLELVGVTELVGAPRRRVVRWWAGPSGLLAAAWLAGS